MRAATIAISCALFAGVLACDREEGLEFDPNCSSCRGEGETCVYSINCGPGHICNDPIEELYDALEPKLVCLQVLCEGDQDCRPNERCTFERLCRPPSCQRDAECMDGLSCVGGLCGKRPDAARAVRCAIMSRHRSIRTGEHRPLTAIAFEESGAVLPLAEFVWSSSDDRIATISSSIAIGGEVAGTATITAAVRGSLAVTCSGLELTNFTPLIEGSARVVVIDEKTGSPLDDVRVTIVAGGSRFSHRTDALGQALWTGTSTVIESVTIIKPRWRTMSVLAPGTNDIFITAIPAEDFTRAGGIRGEVGHSRTPLGDVRAAVVYGARSLDLFEYRAVPLVDIVPAVVDAPEFGANNETWYLPGNIVLGLGNKDHTRNRARCLFDAETPDHLGCFVSRTREGRTAAWVMGGQVGLGKATLISHQTLQFEDENTFTSKDRTRALLFFEPLYRELWFGVIPYLEVETFPKIPREGGAANCADPAKAPVECTGDTAHYQRANIELTQMKTLESRIKVPDLPPLPNEGDGCASAMVASAYAVLPGRGLVLLGWASGKDYADTGVRDCKIAAGTPFGPFSVTVPNGTVGLSAAPLHSGMEGSERILLIHALDIGTGETRPRDLNFIVENIDHLEQDLDLSSRRFLTYPRGRFDREAAAFIRLGPAPEPESTGLRVVLESASGSWTIFAPASMGVVRLPNVETARALVPGIRSGIVQAFDAGRAYETLWSFGSEGTRIRAIATTQCGTSGACTIAE